MERALVHGVVARAVGAERDVAYLPVAVWASSFTMATLSVHPLKYRFRARGPGRWAVYATPALTVAMAVLAVAEILSVRPRGAVLLALLPRALPVGAMAAIQVHARHLKRVGWSLVAADVVTLALPAWALL